MWEGEGVKEWCMYVCMYASMLQNGVWMVHRNQKEKRKKKKRGHIQFIVTV